MRTLHMTATTALGIIFQAGMFLMILGCQEPAPTGTLTVNLTSTAAEADAIIPGNQQNAPGHAGHAQETPVYEEVFITFTEVSVHEADAEGIDNDSDNSTGDNGTVPDPGAGEGGPQSVLNAWDNETGGSWIVISDEEQGFDLLTLPGGVFEELGWARLDAGRYTQIRLSITDALDGEGLPKTYVMVDGERLPLAVPSGAQSGLKLTKPFTVAADNETILYLDFDAAKSVKRNGNGGYMLQPTIRVLTELPQ